MSYSITVQVDEKGKSEVVSASTGDAAPPAGRYMIGGHVHHEGDAASSLSLSTPGGSLSVYLNQ